MRIVPSARVRGTGRVERRKFRFGGKKPPRAVRTSGDRPFLEVSPMLKERGSEAGRLEVTYLMIASEIRPPSTMPMTSRGANA